MTGRHVDNQMADDVSLHLCDRKRPAPHQPSRLIPAELSAIANELAAEDDSLFARAFRAEMERVS